MASELRPFSVRMPSDLTIVVADVTRMAAIRTGLRLTGRVAQFTNFNLSSALEAIKNDEPTVVAVDALLIQTQQGLGFIKRVEGLAKAGCAIRLIVRMAPASPQRYCRVDAPHPFASYPHSDSIDTA